VGEDELVVVSHLSPDAPGRAGQPVYLGHLLAEPRRHAPGLRDVGGAEHVYAAVIGDGLPHLHVHLLPRYPGTPREYWWDRVDEWPDARRGRAPEITALVRDLRAGVQAGTT
jgi:histidine triad (HIT) family protein